VKRAPPDRKASLKRAALSALRRAKRAAERAGVTLSDWEGEFLASVEGRVTTFGRAVADPAKGAAGETLSQLQTVKLKEISAKARGKAAPRRGLQRRRPMRSPSPGTSGP
jgi:hypothetical protein